MIAKQYVKACLATIAKIPPELRITVDKERPEELSRWLERQEKYEQLRLKIKAGKSKTNKETRAINPADWPTRYECEFCEADSIQDTFSFCGNCGRRIVWD